MHFVPAVAAPGNATAQHWCLVFVGSHLLVPEAAPVDLPLQPVTPQGWHAEASSQHYLGQLDGLDCWVLQLPAAPPGWLPLALRAAMLRMVPTLAALAGRAAQVLEWDRAHRFCGVCATPTEAQVAERSRICPACRHVAYPRISPAMMVLIHRSTQDPQADDISRPPPVGVSRLGSGPAPTRELLLARSPHYVKGMYSALAGFVEAGESLEECVHREVQEEVGVTVTDLRYFGSQSWPFPHSLMVAYTARWVSGEIVPQPGEIEDAQWFSLDKLPAVPPRFSIAGHLIRDSIAQMSKPG